MPASLRGASPGDPCAQAGTQHPLKASVESYTRGRIDEALRSARGNVSSAADQLGIPRSTLRYHVEKFGLGQRPSRASKRQVTRSRADAASAGLPTPPPDDTAGGRPVTWERRSVALLRAGLTRPDGAPAALAGSGELDTLVEKVTSLDGVIQEVAPDGIVAAFGLDPIDDAAGLAAHAGIAICRSIERDHRGRSEVAEKVCGCHVRHRPFASTIASDSEWEAPLRALRAAWRDPARCRLAVVVLTALGQK